MLCYGVFCVQAQPGGAIRGDFVRSIPLEGAADARNLGVAVSQDGAFMAVSHGRSSQISVYSLPSGEFLRTFGEHGAGPAQMNMCTKICFNSRGNLLVVDVMNRRVQEYTVLGEHVRSIGVGELEDYVWSIAANDTVIVLGKTDSTVNNRIIVLDHETGVVLDSFGDYGMEPGQLGKYCTGLRLTRDGSHVLVSEGDDGSYKVSKFSLATGEFVRCYGEGDLIAASDVAVDDEDNVYVSDASTNYRVCVYPRDGGPMMLQWGEKGREDGQFEWPVAMSMHANQLYVLDASNPIVQVFE